MDKLTVDQWNELDEADQIIRIDEKPDELSGEKGSDAPKTIEELTVDIKKLNTQLAENEEQKSGMISDLQSERRLRQKLETAVDQLQVQLADKGKADPFADKDDADVMTVGDVKKLVSGLQKDSANAASTTEENDARTRAVNNYNTDETRLQEKESEGKLGKVAYKDAMVEFNIMARKKPALMLAVNTEARATSGKPAELAYTIALTSPKFSNVIAKAAREDLVKELQSKGKLKITHVPGGSPGGTPTDPNMLTEEDLMNMPEAELDKLLQATG